MKHLLPALSSVWSCYAVLKMNEGTALACLNTNLSESCKAFRVSSYLRSDHVYAVHRFVGLLLATKLLPAGNKEVLVAISSAVGFRFLTRLLLPLKAHQVWPGCPACDFTSPAVVSCGVLVSRLLNMTRSCGRSLLQQLDWVLLSCRPFAECEIWHVLKMSWTRSLYLSR